MTTLRLVTAAIADARADETSEQRVADVVEVRRR
jgi:hypothetical protein